MSQTKSLEEIAALKEAWAEDPYWDIELTEGYEIYYDELVRFRDAVLARAPRASAGDKQT